MTSHTICVACCIFIYFMTILWFVKAETPVTQVADTTTLGPEQFVTLTHIEYASTTTSPSSVEGHTVTSGQNSSFTQKSTTALSTPGLYNKLETTATLTTENQTTFNGSLHPNTSMTASTSSITASVTSYEEEYSSTTGNKPLLSTQEHFTLQYNFTTEVTSLKEDTAITNLSEAKSYNLKDSEVIVTSMFSIFLGIVILALLVFSFNKYRRKRSQYSHRPLHDNTFESEVEPKIVLKFQADRYSAPDDTLVISGGLYDAPRVYNPNMTVLEEEESQHDYVSFTSRPGQFRLEFLPGDKEMDPIFDGSSFQPSSSLRKNI